MKHFQQASKPNRLRIPRRQSGLSILEVLIALVILSIGLVGLAGMHLNSLQYVHSAYFRSLASTIALDFEEKAWRQISKTTVDDCLDISASDAYSTLAAAWEDRTVLPNDHWTGWGGTKQAKMPTLGIVSASSDQTIFSETPVTISWSDARFDNTVDMAIVDESGIDEEYVYNIRLLCKTSTSTAGPS
jgi:type IV pilus assembly protein PilV